MRLYLGSADALPPLEGPFDRIYAVNSFGFWPDPDHCLKTLRGLLRPGGRLAIASQPRGRGATAKTTVKAGEEIAAGLSNAGLSAIKLETVRRDPPVVCVIEQNENDESGL